MTPEQLRTLRESRGLTRDELATELGGCTAQAIVKWERGERPIPAWVEEKMLSNVKVTFPLTDLHELLDLAREENISFEDLLSEAIQELVKTRRSRPKAPAPYPVKTGAAYARPFDDPLLKATDAPLVEPPPTKRKAS
jgi:transcriptional regulator with XRE-family HTH domain